jgi:nicotinamide-nucleotide amidase
MLTLYNLANKLNGIVGSTDNFSELSAGFWTLHGDVGDVAPIQSLSKSWEVPALAEIMDVPTSIISATPTDGLGVDAGDEAQFGFSYLQFDLVLFGLLSEMETQVKPSVDDLKIVDNVKARIRSTGYKRVNPVNLDHPVRGNELYSALHNLDDKLLKGE